MQKALKLIREGQLNVSEVSYQTGFSSLSHFSRSFKKVYGKNPSETQGKTLVTQGQSNRVKSLYLHQSKIVLLFAK
ncbi:MAG: helix-turn-helix domain-containing protein [Phaeodactylibacter sp.]|nr:helix-turn-helix domain-containing protein [Phaeodactylibacter sp.]